METLPFESHAREQGLDQGQLLERFLVEFLCLGLTFRIRGGLPVTIVDARKPSVSGNAEAGLDVEGWTSEGKKWLFQCKNKSKVEAKEVRDWMVDVRPRLAGGEIEGAIFLASCPLGRAVSELFEEPSDSEVKWDWWDGRRLTSLLLQHPHRLGCLDLVSRHFTLTIARQFFGEFEKLLISGKEYQSQPRGPGIKHDGAFIGESKVWPKLLEFAHTEAPGQVLLLHASAGLGKTRILIELARRVEVEHMGVCLRFLNPGADLRTASRILPDKAKRCCIVWDDAHQTPELHRFVTEWLQLGARVLIATRLAALPQVRAELAQVGSSSLIEMPLPELGQEEIAELVERALGPATEDGPALASQFARRFHPSPLMARMAVDYWRKHGSAPGSGGAFSDAESALFDHVVEESLQQLPDAQQDSAKRLLRVHALIQPCGYDDELSDKVSALLNCSRLDFDEIWQQLRHCGLLGEYQGNRRLKIQPDALAEHLAFSTCQDPTYKSLVAGMVGLIRMESPDLFPSLLGNLAYVEWRAQSSRRPHQDSDAVWASFAEYFQGLPATNRHWLFSEWKKFGFYVPGRAMKFAESVVTTCVQSYKAEQESNDWEHHYAAPGQTLRGIPTWVASLALGSKESRNQARSFLLWWVKDAGKVLKGNLAAEAILALSPWLDAWTSTPEIARETWAWFVSEDRRPLRDPLLRENIGFLSAFTRPLFQPKPRLPDEVDHRLDYPPLKDSLPGWHTLRLAVVDWLEKESLRDWRIARNATEALVLAVRNHSPRAREEDMTLARKQQHALHDRALAIMVDLTSQQSHPAVIAGIYIHVHHLAKYHPHSRFTTPLNELAKRIDDDRMAQGVLLVTQYWNLLQRGSDGCVETTSERETDDHETEAARRAWADALATQFCTPEELIPWLGVLDADCRAAGLEGFDLSLWRKALQSLFIRYPTLARSLVEAWTPDAPLFVRHHMGWLLRLEAADPVFVQVWLDRILRSGDAASLHGLLANFASPECAALLPHDALRQAFAAVNRDTAWTWSLFIPDLLACDSIVRKLILAEFPWKALSRSGWNQLLQQMHTHREKHAPSTWETLLALAHRAMLERSELPQSINMAWQHLSTWNPALVFSFLEERLARSIQHNQYRSPFPFDFSMSSQAPAEDQQTCARRLIHRCLNCPPKEVRQWRELFSVLTVDPVLVGGLWNEAWGVEGAVIAERIIDALDHDAHLVLLHHPGLARRILHELEAAPPSRAEDLRHRLLYGLLPRMWTGSNREPPAEIVRVQQKALEAAQMEPHGSALRTFFEEAAHMAARQIDDWSHRHAG